MLPLLLLRFERERGITVIIARQDARVGARHAVVAAASMPLLRLSLRVSFRSPDGLLGLALVMDVLELHPWNAAVDDVEHADRIVLDLDPGEGVEWDEVIEQRFLFVTYWKLRAWRAGQR
jgi:hypothetical protein